MLWGSLKADVPTEAAAAAKRWLLCLRAKPLTEVENRGSARLHDLRLYHHLDLDLRLQACLMNNWVILSSMVLFISIVLLASSATQTGAWLLQNES